MTKEILLAGFGGQGILFAGKLLSYIALLDSKEVSWLPSYGPAMRGGTCNCSVCVSDKPIASPLVVNPDILIVMNRPSYDKFIGTVKPDGTAFIDSTLVSVDNAPQGITSHFIKATQLAIDNDIKGMANIIMIGKLLKETNIASGEIVHKAMEKIVPQSKKHLIEINMKAIKLGMSN